MPIDFEDSVMSSGFTAKAGVNNSGSNFTKKVSLRDDDTPNARNSAVSHDSDNIIRSKGVHNP